MPRNYKVDISCAGILLLLLCLVTYQDILGHQFMIDDHTFIRPIAPTFALYGNLSDFFIKPLDLHYSPFYLLLNVKLFKLFSTPMPLYLTNLALFYVDCLLLFIFIYLISADFVTALLTGAIFCIHPMTGDMLQHITFNILFLQAALMLSALVSLYVYAKYNRGIIYYFFSLLMVFLALFCHEIVLLFPIYAAAPLFFLVDFGWKKTVKLIIPFIALDFFLIILRSTIIKPQIPVENAIIMHPAVFWDLAANFSHLFFWYLGNLFVPRSIVFMCNMPPLVGFLWFWNFLLFGFLASCGLLIFRFFKKSLESFAIILFLTGLFYAFLAMHLRHGSQAERGWVFEPNWLYFSSIGFYLFVVLIILKTRDHINRALFIGLIASVYGAYFLSTINTDIISRTEKSYCENWLRKFPGNFIAMNLVANFYRHNTHTGIPSDLVPDMLNMLDLYIGYDYPQKSFELIKSLSSSKISPSQKIQLSYGIAAYYCKNGHYQQCQVAIGRIIGPHPGPYTLMPLCQYLNRVKDTATAVILLKQCMALYPQFKEPYLLMGVILANDGHYEEGIKWWKKGLMKDPSDLRFVSNIEEAENLINKEKTYPGNP